MEPQDGDLSQMANKDELTGAFNRRRFLERVQEELSAARRYRRALTFLVLDVDHLQKINDQFGQVVGDQVLKIIARTCQKALRLTDVFGRLAGEEFGVALVETEAAQGQIVASRLIRHLRAIRMEVDGQPVRFSVSIGSVTTLDGITGVEDLIKQAEDRLKQAKRRGGNSIVWE